MSDQDNNEQTNNEQTNQNGSVQQSVWGNAAPVANTAGTISTDSDSRTHPNNDPSRATEQPETDEDRVAQAQAGVEAAKLPEEKSADKTGPMLDRNWAEQQAAANGETLSDDVNSLKVAGRHGMKKGQEYYVGPRAEGDQNEDDKPSLLDILKNMLEHPFAGKNKKRNSDEATAEANRGKLAENAAQVQSLQKPNTVSPNSALPTADADGPNKVAPGQTIADTTGWESGR